MVTADTDVEELLNLVVCVGKEFEENSKVLESMTEIVKKGNRIVKSMTSIYFCSVLNSLIICYSQFHNRYRSSNN